MAHLLSFVLLLGFAPLAEATVVISEVLADPPSGATGDANRDGQRNGYKDEFIELYNAGTNPISLAGWRLGDSTSPDTHFQFPSDAVVEPGSYVVLFGGGNPVGFTVPVYTDDGRIGNGLKNSGESIHLIDDADTEVAVVAHDPWPKAQSIVRNPLDGEAFEPHKTASPTGDPFSPGRATDAEPETPEVPETPEPETPEAPETETSPEPIPTYALFISEVLADPPDGLAGDANQDGQRNTYEDEFVELYNAGSAPVDISGWRLGDSSSPETHFQFPANAVIEPGSYVVLFGGGNPSGFTVPVYTDDGTIGNGLKNSGESIHLIDDTDTEVVVVAHDPWPSDQSIVRNPPDSEAFVPHKTASPTDAPFSPGRATDAEPETPEAPETPEPEAPETPESETPPEPKPTYALFISEVLTDPPSGATGDANRDGQRDGYEDEFIELYNAGTNPISLAGWRLGDSTSPDTHFQFPPDAVIEPSSYIVLFGGGNPSGFTVPVYTDDGRIGNGLTNGGEAIRLIDNNGHEIAVISHEGWPTKQSLVRHPPGGNALVPHKTASTVKALFSPGHTQIIPKPSYPLFISEVLADPPSGLAGDANRDGRRDTYEDEFIELYNAGSEPISLAGWRLGDSTSPKNYFQFPPDAVIAPHSYIVLFGGGNPSGFTTPVYTDDGKIGNGLTNGGEAIHLIDNNGHEIDVISHDEWPAKQSLARIPSDGGPFVPHKTASPIELPFSPGHASTTRPILTYPLFISEVLADPPEGSAGDANLDGQYDPHEDEFIELYNAGSRPISLAGWRLGDAGSLSDYFRFPDDAVIEPGSYVVLFGGGNPSRFTIPVYTDDGTIGDGLTDTGESIHLIDDYGDEAAFLFQSTWPDDQSLVRTPADGGTFVPHKTASPTEELFSPGHAPETRPVLTYPLFISEVLADPPEGLAGDANRDGRYDPYKDEFIELYNAGPIPISLAGWRLGDAGSLSDYFRFPRDAVIESGSYVVLFGGGRPSGFTVPVYTDDGTIGDGLTNTGESIHLIDDYGDEAAFLYQSTWPDDQSIVRTPADGGTFVPHKTASPTEEPFSPGHPPETQTEPETPETPPEMPETPSKPKPTYVLFISEVLADPPAGAAGDANRDGQRDGYEDEFIELYNADSASVDISGWRLGDSTSPDSYFQFPSDAVIEPGSYVVLFGGGNPSGFTVPVYTDDGRIGNGLTNKGEDIQLINDAGNTVAVVSHGTWPSDQSLVRTPADGGAFVPHKTASPTEAPFSPGHAIAAELETPETPKPETSEPEPKPTYTLFISEVLADPPSGAAGDANRDGQRDGYEDEFIELYNAGSASVDISGWRLGDSTSPDHFFQFPANSVIEPDSYVVLFGGGNPSGFTIPVYTDDGKIGNGLTNKGEDIQLIDEASNTVAIVSHDDWPQDQSIVRTSLDSSAFVPHKIASPTEAPFSPGRAPETSSETPEMVFTEMPQMPPDPIPSPPVLQSLRPARFAFELVRGEHRSLRLIGQYSDGSEHPIDTRATWTSSDSTVATVRPDGTLTAIDIGTCQIFVQLDSFTVHPNVLDVEVRLPLAAAVRFAPSWNEASLPLAKPQAFIIRTTQPHRHAYYWSLNGRRLPVMSPQYIHTPTGRQTDTVHVAIRRGTERITREWIIHPPAAKLPAYSFQVWPNPFNAIVHLRFQLSHAASAHVAIYNIQGQLVRTIVDAPLHAGVHQMRWDGRDERGLSLATGLYFARFRIAHGLPRYAKLILLR